MKLAVDIKVSDLDRAVDFYTEILGLSCRRCESDWAAIVVGDAEIHLYLHGGVSSDVEFCVENLERTVEKLRNKNVEVSTIEEFPWGRAAFFKDTEGNTLSLVKDFE